MGRNLGALQELPRAALTVPATPSLLSSLKQRLQPLGLSSIHDNRSIPRPVAGTYRVQLMGFLNGPTRYTGAAAVDQLVPIP